MTHQQHFHSDAEKWRHTSNDMVEHLTIETSLSQPVITSALDLIDKTLGGRPAVAVDLGSGTGAGTISLAKRFPDLQVHSVDFSATLLEHLVKASAEHGLGDRVQAHQIDIDGQWANQIPAAADIVWASLSLHHSANPGQVLRQAFEVLRPGGVLAMVEMGNESGFIPADLGTGVPSLAEHIRGLAGRRGFPSEAAWRKMLSQAGFADVQCIETGFEVDSQTEQGRKYVDHQIEMVARSLDDESDPEVRRAFQSVIDRGGADNSILGFRSARTVWIATKPESPIVEEELAVDVAVIGGGAAGLSASIALARSNRKVAVVDAGEPRNAPAVGAHNVLGHEGTSPIQILAKGREEAETYGVQIIRGQVEEVKGSEDNFEIVVAGGPAIRARRVIFATGLVDELPEIPGLRQAWGKSVLHCPFCHGWEVRGQRIGVIASNDNFLHQTLLFSELSDQVTVFLNGQTALTADQERQLEALGVALVGEPVKQLLLEGTQVTAVQTTDGQSHALDAVVVAPVFNARTTLYQSLGGIPLESPFGKQIPCDSRGKTPVPGVWAAGNAADPMSMVLSSAAAGVTAGAGVHGELALADLQAAVDALEGVRKH